MTVHPLTHADLRSGADVLALYDDSWWHARVTRVRHARVDVACNIMGAVVPQTVPERDVAVRLDPARHAPPAVGSRVLAAETYNLYKESGADFTLVPTMLGWRRGRIDEVRGDQVTVAFDPEEGDDPGESAEREWLPLQAIACFVDVVIEAPGSLERARGVIRRVAGAGPVLVAATVVQNDVIVAPRRTLASPCTLEREDGTRLRVELGEWPRLSPTTDERGTWDDLQRHPLAAPFADFAPGPHETFTLSGELLSDGDTVEIVGTRTGDVLQPQLIAAGRKARSVADAFLESHAGARQQSEPAAPPGRSDRGPLGHLAPLALAAIGAALWLLAGPGLSAAGAMWTSASLAAAVYHHRSARPLTRFRRVAPGQDAPFHIPGERERGLTGGLVGLYIILAIVVLPLGIVPIAVPEPGVAWFMLPIVGVWSLVLAGILAWREGPQARVLWILRRAGVHRGDGSWGVTPGTFTAGESFTRRIEIHTWTTSRTVTETVKTTDGGTTQVQRQVTDHHSAAGRVEHLPDEIVVSTTHGTLAVRGCKQAVWGTATPTVEDLDRKTGTASACIVDRIGPGDSIAVYGRLKAAPDGRSIDHTGAGSLMIFGAPAGTDAYAVAGARLRGHVVGLLLLLAAALPTLLSALLPRG